MAIGQHAEADGPGLGVPTVVYYVAGFLVPRLARDDLELYATVPER